MSDSNVTGLLLAAGAGRRMGGPKALLRDAGGVPLLDRSVRSLLAGGCEAVTVVLGAAEAEARALLHDLGWSGADRVDAVRAADWAEGMGASLRAGLAALEGTPAIGVLVSLVDLPDVDARVVRRVLDAASGTSTLARASYGGEPGHPVLIGRDHWPGVTSSAEGDRGARGYLEQHVVTLCECGDLATGRDLDRPEDLRR